MGLILKVNFIRSELQLMKNIFFPEDEISKDDLYFVCYMIERIARLLKQPNHYVVNHIGHDGLAKKLSLASVLHSINPKATESDWIKEYDLHPGDYDILNVDTELCPHVPTATQMGKVYKRLILNTIHTNENYADAIIRVYNNPICRVIDNYNTGAYYEPSPYIARSFFAGGFV